MILGTLKVLTIDSEWPQVELRTKQHESHLRKSLQNYKNNTPNLVTCNTKPWGHYGKEGPHDSINYQAAGRLAPSVEGYNVLSHVIMMLQKISYSFYGQDERPRFKNKITLSLREREIIM